MTILAVGLGAWCAFGLGRRYTAESAALVAVGAVWLGTPLLYYTIITPLYSHGIGWFAAALFLYLLPLRAGAPAARWVGAGLAGGFMVANRLQDAPILALGLAALFVAWRSNELRTRSVMSFAAGGLIGYLPQGPQEVTEALSDLHYRNLVAAGGLIKGQTGFAEYVGGVWYGSLDSLKAGHGYKLYLSGAVDSSFLYSAYVPAPPARPVVSRSTNSSARGARSSGSGTPPSSDSSGAAARARS